MHNASMPELGEAGTSKEAFKGHSSAKHDFQKVSANLEQKMSIALPQHYTESSGVGGDSSVLASSHGEPMSVLSVILAWL